MDTKEAIERIKALNDVLYKQEIDLIISVLQRGEAYKQMWNKFKRYRGGVWSNIGNDYVEELMVIYEQKYLPKEK